MDVEATPWHWRHSSVRSGSLAGDAPRGDPQVCPFWGCAAAKVLSVEINRHLVEAAQHHGSDQRCWGENLVEVAINTLYIVYMSVSNKGFVFGYCFLKNKAT